MDNFSKGNVVIGVTLGVIAIFNIAIIFYFRSNPKIKTGYYKSFGKLLTEIRKPWQNEENNIKRLSTMVKTLQDEDDDS